MNNNSINFKVHRTKEGTIFEVTSAVLIALAIALSFVVMNRNPDVGRGMVIQSFIMAGSTALSLILAYAPHTFNIPDDSPAEAFVATIRLVRLASVLMASLSLGITLTALFGLQPVALLIGYGVILVGMIGWYMYRMHIIKRQTKK